MSEALYSVPGVFIETNRGGESEPGGVPVGIPGFVGYCSVRAEAWTPSSGGGSPWPIRLSSIDQIDRYLEAPEWGQLLPALRGYFANGGTHCLVSGLNERQVHNPVNLLGGGLPGDRHGLSAFDATEDVELIAAPDLFLVPPGEEPPGLVDVIGLHHLMLDFCRGTNVTGDFLSRGAYFAILDTPPKLEQEHLVQYAAFLQGHPAAEFGAMFGPWIDVQRADGQLHRMPPSGQIAGMFARASKAPEGEAPGTVAIHAGPHISVGNKSLQDALGAEIELGRLGSKDLLESGINVILPWAGRGMVVWGTRTLSPSSETNQISVRRVLSYVQRSVREGTQWAVFEPNTPSLWKQLKASVESFLEELWKVGVLVGDAQEEAFYVQCDEEINPPDELREGRLNILLLVRPVRSIEFIVLRVTHQGIQAE